jgi:hypothetical protein
MKNSTLLPKFKPSSMSDLIGNSTSALSTRSVETNIDKTKSNENSPKKEEEKSPVRGNNLNF